MATVYGAYDQVAGRSVAIKMGGDLYVESSNGKGTRVTFHLPTGM